MPRPPFLHDTCVTCHLCYPTTCFHWPSHTIMMNPNVPLSYTHKQEENITFMGTQNSTFSTAVLVKERIHSLYSYFQDNAYMCHEWGSAHMTFTTLLLSWCKLWSLWIPSSNCTFTHNIRFWRRFWRLLTAFTLKPVLLCNINFMTANTNKYNFSWMFITWNTDINGPLI